MEKHTRKTTKIRIDEKGKKEKRKKHMDKKEEDTR
jgi:hypothetical protein